MGGEPSGEVKFSLIKFRGDVIFKGGGDERDILREKTMDGGDEGDERGDIFFRDTRLRLKGDQGVRELREEVEGLRELGIEFRFKEGRRGRRRGERREGAISFNPLEGTRDTDTRVKGGNKFSELMMRETNFNEEFFRREPRLREVALKFRATDSESDIGISREFRHKAGGGARGAREMDKTIRGVRETRVRHKGKRNR